MINQMLTQHQDLRHKWKHSSRPPFKEAFHRGLEKHGRAFQSGQTVLTKNPLVLCRDQTVTVKCALVCDPTPQ